MDDRASCSAATSCHGGGRASIQEDNAAAAVQMKHGDRCSAKRVQSGPTSSTNFGMKDEPPALPRRDDVLVDICTAALKPCFSPAEMRTLIAAGGLLPTGKTSTATPTIFHQPAPLWFCQTKEIKSRTSQYATDHSTFWKFKVLETKSRQTLVFDPGGCTGHLRACPFLGAWRALLCREVLCLGTGWYPRLQRFLADGGLGVIILQGRYKQVVYVVCMYWGRSLFLRSQAGLNMSCRQRRHEAI